jgi:hypothetical protein
MPPHRYNQPFAGVEPSKYQVDVRSNTRVCHMWKICPSPTDIVRPAFIVRGLPSGVPCQFRVKAFNNGGWSKYVSGHTCLYPLAAGSVTCFNSLSPSTSNSPQRVRSVQHSPAAIPAHRYSVSTPMVTPGDELTPLNVQVRVWVCVHALP